MNSTLELNFWMRLLGILALEIGLVVALAFIVQLLTQSAFWRRMIWQICFVCLLLLVASEISGVGRGVAVWFAGKPPVERKFSARTIPADEQFIFTPMENEIPPMMEFSEKETPIVQAVWWPGMIWLAGLSLILARILFARILFLTLRWRKTKIIDATLLNRVSELAKRLGIRRKIHLLESRGFSSPMTFGIAQPNIALPKNFAQNFTCAEQNAMLTHELAHVAARDPLWYLLADLTSALLWWHPLVWLARRRLHSASELAADEAAAILENGPGTLAECLVNLGQRLTQSRSFGWLGVDGNGFRSHLGQRVERLLNLKETKPNQLRGWPLFFAKTVASIFFGGLIVFTSGWIQNGKEQRAKNLSAAVKKSWNGSFASMTLAALAEEKKITPSEISASAVIDRNEKLNTNTPNQLTISQANGSKKSILVTAKIFSSPPNVVIKGDPNRTMPSKLATAFSDHLEREKENQLLGTPRMKSNEGEEVKIFLGQEHNIDSNQIFRGIFLNVLPKIKGDSIELDLITRIGDFSKGENWVEDSGVNFRTTVIIPPQESAVLHRQQSAARGGTNYFIIITPQVVTGDETKRNTAAATLVQDGKLLFEIGKLDEAEIKLNEALKIDAENKAALYYKPLVNEAQQARPQQRPRVELIRPTIPPTTLDKTIVEAPKASSSSNSSARSNVVYTSKGRQTIKAKLDRIRLSEVQFENLPLGEVLKMLRGESKKQDSEHRGINFLFNSNPDAPGTSTNPVDINKITIHINPPLKDIRLADVLDAIVQVAEQRLEYKIEDYAVVFSPKSPEAIKLYTRVYKLNPDKFLKALEKFPPANSEPLRLEDFPAIESREITYVVKTNLSADLNLRVREFLKSAGVEFGSPQPANGKSVFFKDREGLLMVRASQEDLGKIQNAIQSFGAETPQVTIETKFVEIDEATGKALGFDWLPDNTLVSLKTNRISSEVFSLNGSKIVSIAKNPLTNSLTTIVTGILTDPQYRTILKSLEKHGDTDILSVPQVTTLSGRQTQISAQDLIRVVTGVSPTKNDAGIFTNSFETQTLPFGPVLDVLPSVLMDGFSIEMTIIASVTDFLGYDKGGKPAQQLNATAQIPLSRVRIRQATTSARVWDGQTIVLAGMMDQVDKGKKTSGRKNLLVFVTATMIDPAGNRVHTDEDLPFATNSVPKQPEQN